MFNCRFPRFANRTTFSPYATIDGFKGFFLSTLLWTEFTEGGGKKLQSLPCQGEGPGGGPKMQSGTERTMSDGDLFMRGAYAIMIAAIKILF